MEENEENSDDPSNNNGGFVMNNEEMLIEENSEVEVLTDSLCTAIQNSEEYKNYKKCLEEIKMDEELYRQVNSLRRNNFFSQNGNNGRMSYDEYHNIYNATRVLRQNDIVDRFLDSELDLIRMIQIINEKIIKTVDFECDFL